MLTKISHIILLVNELDETFIFYQKLGFKIYTEADFGKNRWKTIYLDTTPRFEIVLMQAVSDEEKALVGKQGGNNAFLSLETTDIHNYFARLKQSGINIIDEPGNQPWAKSGMIQDTCGNMIFIRELT